MKKSLTILLDKFDGKYKIHNIIKMMQYFGLAMLQKTKPIWVLIGPNVTLLSMHFACICPARWHKFLNINYKRLTEVTKLTIKCRSSITSQEAQHHRALTMWKQECSLSLFFSFHPLNTKFGSILANKNAFRNSLYIFTI